MTDSYEFSPIIPSKNHHVFFELPLEGEGPPKPLSCRSEDRWDDAHVKMPNSEANIDPASKRKIWDVILAAFENLPRNFEELRASILSYAGLSPEGDSFSGLETYLKEEISIEESKHFFEDLLPKIIALALELPEEVRKPVPLLRQGIPMTLSLSQKQIGILLANAFLCTFPPRPTSGDKCGTGDYPDINFNRLFMRHEVHAKEKFKCIFNYFERITSQEPYGVVTFTRSKAGNLDFECCDKPLPDLKLKLEGGIEEAKGHLQVDFADRYIGGMIFTKGCVQEEIRFLVSPELIVTRLFSAVLEKDEALIVTGTEQYNLSSGYGRQFRFVSSFEDETPRDHFRRRKNQLTAIDAVNFNRRSNEQYEPVNIRREFRKAYAGFLPEEGTPQPFTPVATGNWGCGVFRGNPYLKSLIQLVAAGAAGRDVTYFAFGNGNLVKDLTKLHELLKSNNVTVGNLTKLLISYREVGGKLSGKGLFEYIRKSVRQNK